MSGMISAEAAVHFCWHRGPRCRRCCRAAQPAGDAGGVLRAAAPSAVPLRRRRAQPLCRCSGGGGRRRAHQAVPHLPHRAARGGQLHAGPAGALPCCCYAAERFSRRMHLKHGRAYSSHTAPMCPRDRQPCITTLRCWTASLPPFGRCGSDKCLLCTNAGARPAVGKLPHVRSRFQPAGLCAAGEFWKQCMAQLFAALCLHTRLHAVNSAIQLIQLASEAYVHQMLHEQTISRPLAI
jgi:hypothetical protein